jgi:hypothetical protein
MGRLAALQMVSLGQQQHSGHFKAWGQLQDPLAAQSGQQQV